MADPPLIVARALPATRFIEIATAAPPVPPPPMERRKAQDIPPVEADIFAAPLCKSVSSISIMEEAESKLRTIVPATPTVPPPPTPRLTLINALFCIASTCNKPEE